VIGKRVLTMAAVCAATTGVLGMGVGVASADSLPPSVCSSATGCSGNGNANPINGTNTIKDRAGCAIGLGMNAFPATWPVRVIGVGAGAYFGCN
jgi:hypothetical protein